MPNPAPPSPEPVADDLRVAAQAWAAEDPGPRTRAEVEALLAAGDAAALADRFGARLQFGTAGLRGKLGAGPNRMNRALVRRAAAGRGRPGPSPPGHGNGGRRGGDRLRRPPPVRPVRGRYRSGDGGRRNPGPA